MKKVYFSAIFCTALVACTQVATPVVQQPIAIPEASESSSSSSVNPYGSEIPDFSQEPIDVPLDGLKGNIVIYKDVHAAATDVHRGLPIENDCGSMKMAAGHKEALQTFYADKDAMIYTVMIDNKPLFAVLVLPNMDYTDLKVANDDWVSHACGAGIFGPRIFNKQWLVLTMDQSMRDAPGEPTRDEIFKKITLR